MKVAIDCSEYYRLKASGAKTYVVRLAEELAALQADDEFLLWCMSRRPLAETRPPVVAPNFQTTVVRRSRWWFTRWGRYLGRPTIEDCLGPVDLVHLVLPFPLRARRTKVLVTVQDLRRFMVDELYEPRYEREFRRSLETADRLIVSSEATRRDLAELFDRDSDQVSVVPFGVSEQFRPASRAQLEARLPPALRGRRFVIGLSSYDRRKNVPNLVRGFARFKKGTGWDGSLLIVGKHPERGESIDAAARDEGVTDHVLAPGFVDDLPACMAAAELFVFPSWYEGFGLPILEAMASGTPVAGSNVSSIPEVGGDCAEYFDPRDPESIAAAIERVLTNPDRAATMVSAGLARSAQFTWRRCAEETLAIYREMVGDA
jgi:alpha-1,3-rhamnosyl/mannosyltransferase